MRVYQIGANEAQQRLDKYLKKLLKEAPDSFIYKMMRKKNIVLNGKKCDGKEKLEAKGISTNARLFRNASELLLLDWDSQKIWAWENEDFSLKWDLAKSGLEKSYSGNPFIQNGSLWLYGSQTDETERAELVSVDLEAGTAQMCWPKTLQSSFPMGRISFWLCSGMSSNGATVFWFCRPKPAMRLPNWMPLPSLA